MKRLKVADMFCGAGGTSTGLMNACERIGRRVDLVAVNHWDRAVETHAANHPSAKHLCQDLTTADPRKAVPGGRLDLLLASPECTHHSIARGGKPSTDQGRASAWCVLRWATALTIDRILIENVREFISWGPIGANGKPMKSRRGETFTAFVDALRSLGYRVDWRLLNAANFGAATTRERLFIQAVRGNRKIAWPDASHGKAATPGLFSRLKPWRAAREVIDWALVGTSIFNRKRPLSENTLKRIEAGLRKFGGAAAEPFLVLLRGTAADQIDGTARHLCEPVPALTTGPNVGLCEPFIMPVTHRGRHERGSSVDSPLPTITTAKRGEQALIQPFIVPQFSQNDPRSIDRPLGCVTTTSRGMGLCEPFILPHRQFDGMQVDSINAPMRTVTAQNGGNNAIVEPFVIPTAFGEAPGQSPRCHSVNKPLPTVVGSQTHGVCEPFLVNYHGNGQPHDVQAPLRTADCKDRYGLVQPETQRLDIRFRMLQPHELAAAMSFPKGYIFTGNRADQVKQIGNAVDCRQAEALCNVMLEGL